MQRKDISIIIPACNESRTLRINLRRLSAWPAVKEIIVVANGCTDNTVQVAQAYGAKVITFSEMLGHDTGRAVGAAHASGRFLLFLDGDILWRPVELRPFVQVLRNGADVALNGYPLRSSRYYHHPTAIAKRALNLMLNRDDLQAASMTAVPHAIRRSAIAKLGIESLAIPPVAQARAIMEGLSVVTARHIDVRTRNRWIRRYPRQYSTKEMIIGDHLEAVHEIIARRGMRAGFEDRSRQRAILKDMKQDREITSRAETAVIIPARNEARTLGRVIREAMRAHVSQVCVVDNGSTDHTAAIAVHEGAEVQQFDHALGHDVGRAVGLKQIQKTKCALILDADFYIGANDLKSFRNAVLKSGTDVALNDLSNGLSDWQKCDAVSTVKAFLNIAMNRADLGIASLTAIPHALSERALAHIPNEDFAVPPKALVRAQLADLQIAAVHYVDVVRRNRFRRVSHGKKSGRRMTKLIVGDHVEALALLLSIKGTRGGFVQPRSLTAISSTALERVQSQ